MEQEEHILWKKDRTIVCIVCIFLFSITGLAALIYQLNANGFENVSKEKEAIECYKKRDTCIGVTLFIFFFAIIIISLANLTTN